MEKNVDEEFKRSEELFGEPIITSFVCAMASMVFSEDFMGMVQKREWGMMIFWVIVTWVGFWMFRGVVVASFSVFAKSWNLFDRAGKWLRPIAIVFSVVVFAAIFWITHVILK